MPKSWSVEDAEIDRDSLVIPEEVMLGELDSKLEIVAASEFKTEFI